MKFDQNCVKPLHLTPLRSIHHVGHLGSEWFAFSIAKISMAQSYRWLFNKTHLNIDAIAHIAVSKISSSRFCVLALLSMLPFESYTLAKSEMLCACVFEPYRYTVIFVHNSLYSILKKKKHWKQLIKSNLHIISVFHSLSIGILRPVSVWDGTMLRKKHAHIKAKAKQHGTNARFDWQRNTFNILKLFNKSKASQTRIKTHTLRNAHISVIVAQ